jgi:bifunctional NMN adenylyltransferase/nudix hydrolase
MKIGVFIGRFQPVTNTHSRIINQSLRKYDKLIVIVGSAKASCSLRNPFDEQTRINMVFEAAGKLKMNKLHVCPVADSNYNFNQWIRTIQGTVSAIISEFEYKTDNDEIYLIGSFKDAGSYWLNSFPHWKIDNIPLEKEPSGTDVRRAFLKNNPHWEMMVDIPVKDFLLKWQLQNRDLFLNLSQEQIFIDEYRRQWDNSPYPPTFITTDSIVFCKGHILIIKRKKNPGKNQYALPGGHLEVNEYIKDCAIRELKEETKIDVARPILENSLKKVKIFDDPIRDPRGRYITHVHVFDLNIKDLPAVKADDDAKEVRWLPFSEIDNLQNKFFIDHYQIIKNIIES